MYFQPSCRCSRRLDMSFLPEMFVPVLVLVVVFPQRPNPTEARRGHGDQPPRLRPPPARGPTGLGAPPPAHEPISNFSQRLPPGAMGPQHTPALAHNALKPQAIARRRAFRKATHRFAQPAARKRTCSPRARSRTTTRDKHYSCTAQLKGWFCPGVRHGLTFGVAAPASPSQHITSVGTRPLASPRRLAPAPPHRREYP
jgi:hypothetical protein